MIMVTSHNETIPGSSSIPDAEKGTAKLTASQHTAQTQCKAGSVGIGLSFVPQRRLHSPKQFVSRLLLIPALLSLVLSTSAIAWYPGPRSREFLSSQHKDSDNYDLGAPFAPVNTQRLWGGYAPYYSVEEYLPPPADCRLTQVNILQRHGARYPTSALAAQIALALQRLQAAEFYTDKRLQFLENYMYNLGTNDLLPFGEREAMESGRKAFLRYHSLSSRQNLPFVRAAGSERVVKSASGWIDGFSLASHNTSEPALALIIPEDSVNNTLENGGCLNAVDPGTQVEEWQNIYAQPIADRLNAAAHGMPVNLTAQDAESLISLCALETVAKEEYSPFCELFSEEDFQRYEYSFDLEKLYHTGYGSPWGPVQGVGYVNELLARLTDQPVHDETQTNHTLDSDPKTFPLGRGIYADLSHDDLIVAVIGALGLTGNDVTRHSNATRPLLDPTKFTKNRDWYTSKMVPFSGRMVFERMECTKARRCLDRLGHEMACGDRDGSGSHQVYVRMLMDDAVQDTAFCNGSKDGLCTLEGFVQSQKYARENGQGDWEKCFQ